MAPLSDIVVVNITAQVGGLTQRGFGTPLILGYTPTWVERVRYYSDLAGIATDLGARTVPLAGVDRALYHAAAVLIANDAVALAAAATRAWTLAGLPQDAAREALAPLLLGAASSIAALPLAEALTGPLARGDIATVERHLDALARDPTLAALYRALAAELLRLPLAHSEATAARLRALLDTPPASA